MTINSHGILKNSGLCGCQSIQSNNRKVYLTRKIDIHIIRKQGYQRHTLHCSMQKMKQFLFLIGFIGLKSNTYFAINCKNSSEGAVDW